MLAIGIILIVAAVFLTIAVLMQHGKSHNLSGTIAGASETFFGKSKASTIDKKLSVLTTVVAIVFVVLVLVAYLVQDIDTGKATATNTGAQISSGEKTTQTTTTASNKETEDPKGDTDAKGDESSKDDESASESESASASESASDNEPANSESGSDAE